jgi:undecaprenyl-diphosphatase
MLPLPIANPVLLGAVAGLTECLPISSGGHLALVRILFGLEVNRLGMGTLLEMGTLLSVVLFLRRELAFAFGMRPRGRAQAPRFAAQQGRDALLILITSLPMVATSVALWSTAERWTHSPRWVGLGFCMTSVTLASSYWLGEGKKLDPGIGAALLVGVAQGLATLPGLSRAGLTIVSLLWLGLRRERAFELGLLMCLPAMLVRFLLGLPELERSLLWIGVGLVSASVAMLMGLLGLWLLRRLVEKGYLALFALWTLPVGLATLAMSLAWPG